MTQTTSIDAFGGHDPNVEIWAEILPGVAEAFTAAQEKIKAVANSAGSAALNSVAKIAS